MFGPLPLLHRIMLALVTAASGVLAGAWTAHVTSLPVAVSVAAVAGGLLGLVGAYALAHQPQPQPVRVTRRR
jgi:ABC-type xylose transport system permease subunit